MTKKIQTAASDYLNKNVTSLIESNPGKAHSVLKKMGAKEGDLLDDGSFSLLSHKEENLSLKDYTDRIAQHFAKISQEYDALNLNSLPDDVKNALNEFSETFGSKPVLNELEVFQKLSSAKKTKSGVPGDLPRSLLKEFAPELAKPLMKIYNRIIDSGEWPRKWLIEHGLPLQNEDDF